jgi:hypothetical protein
MLPSLLSYLLRIGLLHRNFHHAQEMRVRITTFFRKNF